MQRFLISALLLATAASVQAAELRVPVTAFQRVAASGSEDVTVITGKTPTVTAVGPQERLDRLDIRVEGDTLKIGHKKGSWSNWGRESVKITVTMPALFGASLAGSGDFTADGGSGPAFKVSLAGSGDVRVSRIDSPSVTLSTAGSGDIAASGKCGALKVSIAGSGDMDLVGLKCADADIGISGSGDVTTFATGTANVRISGSGDVKVSGGAKCQSRTSGSGSVSCG